MQCYDSGVIPHPPSFHFHTPPVRSAGIATTVPNTRCMLLEYKCVFPNTLFKCVLESLHASVCGIFGNDVPGVSKGVVIYNGSEGKYVLSYEWLENVGNVIKEDLDRQLSANPYVEKINLGDRYLNVNVCCTPEVVFRAPPPSVTSSDATSALSVPAPVHVPKEKDETKEDDVSEKKSSDKTKIRENEGFTNDVTYTHRNKTIHPLILKMAIKTYKKEKGFYGKDARSSDRRKNKGWGNKGICKKHQVK